MIAGEASVTAKICAFARAHHAMNTKQPIYNDYLAYDLLGEKEYQIVKGNIVKLLSDRSWEIPFHDTWDGFINQFISPIIISRSEYTRIQLKSFVKDDQEEYQYVICGAGLDSFAFRNTNKNLKIFELDHPDTQEYKKHRIAELGWQLPAQVQYLSIDFEKQSMEEVLLGKGFDPTKKTLFAILGVTYYLSLETFSHTLSSIAKLSENKETQIVFDYPDKDIVRRGRTNPRMAALIDFTSQLGEVMQGGMNFKELSEELNKVGFYIKEYENPQVIQERYFENRDDELQAYENIAFMTAEKN